MGGDLAIPVIIFLASAASVIYLGGMLAKYGDALASLTGWGRLFVGGMLIAAATSLPELSTTISAVRLDPPNPELAVGTVLGANVYNMLKLSVVVLIFGGKRFLQRVAPEQGYLIVLGIVLTGLAILFGAVKMDVSLLQIGLSSVILIVVFVVGMRVVYVTRPQAEDDSEGAGVPAMTLRRTWVVFLTVSAGVVVAGFFLAWSADQIAREAGVASSALGILAVALVASLPEWSMAFAAARIGAADLAVAGICGSNVFNVSILFFADPFYRAGILGNQMEPMHFIAGGTAVGLMSVGLVLILGRNRLKAVVATAALVLMTSVSIAGFVAVAILGTMDKPDTPSSHGTLTQSLSERQDPWSDRPHRNSTTASAIGSSVDNPL